MSIKNLWRKFFPICGTNGIELPSWIVIYEDGKRSVALRREDAETRAKLFGGVRIEWGRDAQGNLL